MRNCMLLFSGVTGPVSVQQETILFTFIFGPQTKYVVEYTEHYFLEGPSIVRFTSVHTEIQHWNPLRPPLCLHGNKLRNIDVVIFFFGVEGNRLRGRSPIQLVLAVSFWDGRKSRARRRGRDGDGGTEHVHCSGVDRSRDRHRHRYGGRKVEVVHCDGGAQVVHRRHAHWRHRGAPAPGRQRRRHGWERRRGAQHGHLARQRVRRRRRGGRTGRRRGVFCSVRCDFQSLGDRHRPDHGAQHRRRGDDGEGRRGGGGRASGGRRRDRNGEKILLRLRSGAGGGATHGDLDAVRNHQDTEELQGRPQGAAEHAHHRVSACEAGVVCRGVADDGGHHQGIVGTANGRDADDRATPSAVD
mmetsp:Transcript_12804/g.25576  ORF Transcript_12804/g.25576 Transcript_12804/m.25576 type:complete len:356 (-) Transcript_12804:190-1257(-)